MKFINVPAHAETCSAKDFLTAQFPDLSTGYLHQLLKKGKFLLRNVPLKAESLVSAGDILQLPGNQNFQQQIAEGSPAILLESNTLLIVNKPTQLAVHASLSHQHDNLLLRMDKTMRQRKAPYRLHAVHRLDKETTGALLLAKGKKAARELGQIMMAGGISKQYLALVSGQLPEQGTLESPVSSHGKLREATSHYRRLGQAGSVSLLEVEPISGRTHQIRRQLADIGHSLLGDRRYGGHQPGDVDFFLHSYQLSLSLPGNSTPLKVIAPLPEALTNKLLQLGFQEIPGIFDPNRYREIGG